MSIGAKIKEYRVKSGLTQKDLADKLFVTYQAVSRWENNEAEPSYDTLRDICKILNCSTNDLFELDSRKDVEPPKESIKVVEKIIVQEPKIVLGICDKCGKPIYDQSDLKKHYESHSVGSGPVRRSENKLVILCSNCDRRRLEIEKAERERQERLKIETRNKRRVHSFVWPSILAAALITISIINFAQNDLSNGSLWLVAAIFGYTFLATMILNNTFIPNMWMEITSWGFVRLPGVIFSFDIDGCLFFIAMKILLFLLGIALALLSAGFATAISMMLSIFVYPYALNKNIKKLEE